MEIRGTKPQGGSLLDSAVRAHCQIIPLINLDATGPVMVLLIERHKRDVADASSIMDTRGYTMVHVVHSGCI